jgi:LuxR family quorum-sensing system transcriptional regulator ExpR
MLDQLTRSELLQVLELATQCLAVTCLEQLETILSSTNGLANYSKAALCAFSCNDNELVLTHYINHSYGDEWVELYTRQNFQHSDPVLIHASTTMGAFRWDEIPASANREGSAVFLEAAKEFGIADGVSFSFAERSPTHRSVLSLAGVPADELDRTQQILTALGPHVHEAYHRLLQRPPDRGSAGHRNARKNTAAGPARQRNGVENSLPQNHAIELSEREREALNWAQHGKTYWEIGCILGISQRTVKFHFARIKSKLNVVNTSHAIAKAMRMGLIT